MLGITIEREDGFNPDLVLVDLKIETVKGPVYLAEKMPLIALLESKSYHEGYFHREAFTTVNGLMVGSQVVGIDGVIDVSRQGAIDFTTGATLTLSVYTSEAVTFDLIMVDTYSVASQSNIAEAYIPLTVENGQTRDLGTLQFSRLLIPDDKLDEVRVRYADNVIPYKVRELRRIQRMVNDIVCTNKLTGQTTVFGFGKWLIVEFVGALSVSVTPLAGVGAYQIYGAKEISAASV